MADVTGTSFLKRIDNVKKIGPYKKIAYACCESNFGQLCVGLYIRYRKDTEV